MAAVFHRRPARCCPGRLGRRLSRTAGTGQRALFTYFHFAAAVMGVDVTEPHCFGLPFWAWPRTWASAHPPPPGNGDHPDRTVTGGYMPEDGPLPVPDSPVSGLAWSPSRSRSALRWTSVVPCMGVLPGVACPPAGAFRKALPLVSARVVLRVRRVVFSSWGLAVPPGGGRLARPCAWKAGPRPVLQVRIPRRASARVEGGGRNEVVYFLA